MRDHYLKLHENDERFNYHRQIVQEYETIVKRQEAIRNIIPYLLLKGFILLSTSSSALFFIGIGDYVNIVIFFIGILVLLTTLSFLINLNSVIVETVYVNTIKELKLKKFFINYKGD